MIDSAAHWIQTLGLEAHPEGGYFKETYRSAGSFATPGGPRNHSTAIYFLLGPGQFSRLHRLRSDELWHFYAGVGLTLSILHPDGRLETAPLGPPFQTLVPAGAWFGARPHTADGYSLVGCTMAPGFDFADFELGNRAALCRQFPQHIPTIESLCP